MPAHFSHRSWVHDPLLVRIVAHCYKPHKDAVRKKYKVTEEALLQRYNLAFKEDLLKQTASTFEAEAAKPDDGYNSEDERAKLHVRYPQSATAPSSTAAAAAAAVHAAQAAAASSATPTLAAAATPSPFTTLLPLLSGTQTLAAAAPASSDAHLAVLQDIATSLRSIAQTLSGRRARVAAAVKLLQSGEADDDDSDADDSGSKSSKQGTKRKRGASDAPSAEEAEEEAAAEEEKEPTPKADEAMEDAPSSAAAAAASSASPAKVAAVASDKASESPIVKRLGRASGGRGGKSS